MKHTLTPYPSKSSEITTKSKTFQKIIRLLSKHNSIWHFAIYQSKLFSPLNEIKYILKHLQHTFPHNIKHTLTLYPSKSSEIYIKSQTFQKTLSLLAEHNSIWHIAIYQSKDFSPLNAIKININHLQHTFPHTMKHRLTLYPSKSSEITTKSKTFQKIIRLLAEHNSIWHFAIYQSKLFSPLNEIKYILKHLQHTFPHNIKHTLTLYPSKSSEIYIKSQTFQKTLSLLAEHNSIWHIAIYQSKDFSPLNAIKININHLQHTFPHTMKHRLTLYPSKSSEITTKSKTFQKIIRLLAEHNSIWHFAIYQSKLFSPLNAIKYILKYLQHTFRTPSSIHLRSTHQNPQRSLLNHRHLAKYQIYLCTQLNLTHCDNQSKDFSPVNAIKIIINHLQHTFPPTIKHTLTLYPSKSSEITTESQITSKISDLSRNTIQFDTLRFTNQKPSRL